MFKKYVFIGAILILAPLLSHAEDVFEISTKPGEYNEVLLNQPFVDALFNDKDAVDGKFVVINNNKNLLFKIKPEIKKDLQLFIVLRDGSRKKIRIIPNPNINGQSWPKESFGVNKQGKGFKLNKSKQDIVDLLKDLYKVDENGNRIPLESFVEEVATDVAYYGPVLIREIKRLSNAEYRISVYMLSSSQKVNVTSADFYRKDVIAIELNYDVVDKSEIPMVVISREEGGQNG